MHAYIDINEIRRSHLSHEKISGAPKTESSAKLRSSGPKIEKRAYIKIDLHTILRSHLSHEKISGAPKTESSAKLRSSGPSVPK